MRTHTLTALFFLLCAAGCSTLGNTGITPVTPEADKQKIVINPDLIKDCPPITDKLITGSEDDVVQWAKRVLEEASDCRKQHKALVDWVDGTFKVAK